MRKIERKEQGLVLLGYVLLLMLVGLSFFIVWKQLEELERPAAEEMLIAQRRSATFDFVLAMHETETSAVGATSGQRNDFVRYATLVDTTLARLDTLRLLLTDIPQQARLDTLRELIIRKRRSIATLTSLMGRDDIVDFYEQQIKRINIHRDTVPSQQVKRHVTIQTDTVMQAPKKKNFFQRLAEAFVPSKQDSVIVQQIVREVSADTLLSHVNTADTIVSIIDEVQDQARRYRVQTNRDVRKAMSRIGRESLAISQRANQLLADFDEEEQRLADIRAADARRLRTQAAFTLAGTTGCALLLAIFFLCLIWRDLRRARHYREELEEARARAEHLLATREKLMLAVTHDLKAPAGAVLGYADLLGRHVGDKRAASYVDNIRHAANHLLDLVRSLLDFHKLDAHRVEPEHIPFDVAALFDEIYRTYVPTAEAKGLRLHYSSNIAVRQATGDPLRLRQMTENLLSNAVKFTTKGFINLRVTARDGRLAVSVRDTGRGIPATEQDKLFGEFARMSNARGEEGFGLGLAITRKNAQLLGGDITVESQEGCGSTFTFDVPLAEGHSALPPARSKQLRVALLDDDVLQLQLCATMLRNEGHEVDCFDTPERLVCNLHESRYDVLLTDIQMPGLNGFELVRKLRDDKHPKLDGLRIIAVTARDDISADTFRESGFDGCLRKPFSPSALRTCLGGQPADTANGTATTQDGSATRRNGSPDESPAPADTAENRPKVPTWQADQPQWDALLFFAAGDPEAEADILRTYAAETRNTAEGLERACAAQDTREIARLSHKALPVCRQLGIRALIVPFETWERLRDGFEWEAGIAEKVRDLTNVMSRLAEEAEKRANFALHKKITDEKATVG